MMIMMIMRGLIFPKKNRALFDLWMSPDDIY